jgi:hypothetical protein
MRTTSRYVLSALLVLPLGIGAVHAQSATAGLGQSWPATTDVSSNPGYHVYLFQRGSNHYIQVNDANGNVLGAFVKTAYSLVGLPVGGAGNTLATPDEPLATPPATAGDLVYSDGATSVYVAPKPGGGMQLLAVPGDCTNPKQCTSHGP